MAYLLSALVLGTLFWFGYRIFNKGYQVILQAKQTEKWKSTEGIIIKSKTSTTVEHRTYLYVFELEYIYSVKNEVYQGNTIYTGQTIKSRNPINDYYLEEYSKDSEVIAYFNPRKPEESCLVKGVHKSLYAPLFISFIFMGNSILLFILILLTL